MQIWVDADACPKAIKEILFRAATRVQVPLVLVANQPLRVRASKYIKTLLVPPGADYADKQIVEDMAIGDLVITADIPLAAAVVEKGGQALNPRGKLYTKDNVQEILVMRDVMTELRGTGQISGGPPPHSTKEHQAFANQLDRFLTRYRRSPTR